MLVNYLSIIVFMWISELIGVEGYESGAQRHTMRPKLDAHVCSSAGEIYRHDPFAQTQQ